MRGSRGRKRGRTGRREGKRGKTSKGDSHKQRKRENFG